MIGDFLVVVRFQNFVRVRFQNLVRNFEIAAKNNLSDFKILYEISKSRRKIIRAEIPFYEMVSTT